MRKRRGVNVHLLHQMKGSGKWDGKSNVLSGSSSERRAVQDYLESSADIQVDVGVLERLIEPEDEKVCLRCILKYSTRRGSNMFKIFDTSEKKDHLVASSTRWVERQTSIFHKGVDCAMWLQFEGCATSDPHSCSSWVEVELPTFRRVLQDALSEVMKVYPPLKLKVFVADIAAFMEQRNKELPGIAENLLKSIRREIEEKFLKLSIKEGGKEGEINVVASCSNIKEVSGVQQERMCRSCNRCGDIRLGADLRERERTRQLGAKEMATTGSADVRSTAARRNRVSRRTI